jgi:hypothetical protein
MKEVIGFANAKIEDYLSFVDDLGELDNISLEVWIDSTVNPEEDYAIEDYEIYSGIVKLNIDDLIKAGFKNYIDNALEKAQEKYIDDYKDRQAEDRAEAQADAREAR